MQKNSVMNIDVRDLCINLADDFARSEVAKESEKMPDRHQAVLFAGPNDLTQLASSFWNRGFDVAQGTLRVREASPEDVKRYVAELDARIAFYETRTEAAAFILPAGEDKPVPVDPGQYLEILRNRRKRADKATHALVSGFRRSEALFVCMAFARHTQATDKMNDLAQVPARLTVGSDIDVRIDNLRENLERETGRRVGLKELAKAVRPLMAHGYTEADVMRATGLKRGSAQKVYAYNHGVTLLARETGKDIDEVFKETVLGNKEDMRKAVSEFNEGKKSIEEVEATFKGATSQTDPVRVMTKTEIQAVKDSVHSKALARILNGVLRNDPTEFDFMNENAKAFDALMEKVETPEEEEVAPTKKADAAKASKAKAPKPKTRAKARK